MGTPFAMRVAGAETTQPAAPAEKYEQDFDAAWRFVRDNYAYFDQKLIDWSRVHTHFAPMAKAARTDDELIGVLERMLEQLYDSHAHLGINTATSPRLVPSGTDVWAEHRDGRALITGVRAGSQAECVGLREGMEILSIDGRPVDQAVAARRPIALRQPDRLADDWALRAELAGRRGRPVEVEVRDDEQRTRRARLDPEQRDRSDAPLAVSFVATDVAYVRIHDSLGDQALIAAWDAALVAVRESRGLILDLRDTPSGGNTTIARGLLSRLVSEPRPYQRHELPSEERQYGVKRIWVEYVAPRGPFPYDRPIVALVGRWTGSMGEGVAIALDGMKRATVVGTRMAQLLGATESMSLPNTRFQVRVPTEKLYHVDGTPREAFQPQSPPATHSPEGDPAMAAALALLRP